MALDSNRAARWVFDTLHADATLATILGGAKVYRRAAPRTSTKPVVVVEVQSTQPPIGAVLTGHDTHWATPVTVRTSVWDTATYAKIEQAADRICELLDGKSFQVVAGGGEVLCCTKGIDLPRELQEGDVSYLGWDIMWDIDAKA